MRTRRTRVAFFADCLIENYDGAIRTMYEIINRIPRDRFEFLFITGERPQGKFEHDVLKVPSLPLPINHNYKLTLSFLSQGRLHQKLRAYKPDVIHLSTPSPLGHAGLKYGMTHSIPVISIYHTHFISYVDYYLQDLPFVVPPVRRHMTSMLQKFYNQCDLVYVPTDEMRSCLRSMGVFSNHLEIWKRGLTPGLFSPDKRTKGLLPSITKNKHPNILFSSRLVWEKNLETLADIYHQAEKKKLSYNFIIAGDGYAKDKLQSMMPKAIFLGHLNHQDLSTIYASSDIFSFPSISETYGNVVIEAMASGLPCVIADGGGTRDIVTHGYNGLICPPNDAISYLTAIESILTEPNLTNRIIENGISQTKNLSWDQLCERYFKDIEGLNSKHLLQRA